MPLLFWPEADESLSRLENDPALASTLRAVRRTFARLERDPAEPRLGTRQFATPNLGHVRVTPVHEGDWHVFWQLGRDPGTIEVLQIAEQAP